MQFEGLSTVLEYADKTGILLPVLIVLVVIVYAPKVMGLIDSWKMRKINYLSTLYGNELLTDEIKKMLQDEINNAAFKSIHGIRVDTLLREQLNTLHNTDKDRFSWKRLRMADPYIEVDDNGIVIKFHWYDRLVYAFSWFGIVAALLTFLFAWFNFAVKHDVGTLLSAIMMLIGMGILFFMFLYQIMQYIHAKRLMGYMNEPDIGGDK